MISNSMFWNWIRWQCLNRKDWNFGEIPAGTMIDDDQFIVQFLSLMKNILKRKCNKGCVSKR